MQEHLDRPVVGITYSMRDLEGFLLWRHMFHAFVAAGATPVSIDCTVEQPRIYAIIERLDGLVISGGGDVDPDLYGGDSSDTLLRGVNPARDVSERAALHVALDHGMPILAICRGLQFVNVALGGTLHADLARDRPGSLAHQESEEALARPVHDVRVEGGSLLAKWMGGDGVIPVNSEHHQGVSELGRQLTAVAFSSDGLVEAAESAENNLVGVQWHPEILWPYEPHSASLIRGYVSECGAFGQAASRV
ncbi:gamma-glutamyl-gamma-aminobutyrate hydrolase family protein [Nocardioides sp.]|uniref:gamma-glutamyl-gamma-aminobutyrate hydrolase family protein n=1 Tax=Nocardioides sp. TaxID=35761 RepID=UPI003D10BAD6